jgi:hypothetical protein
MHTRFAGTHSAAPRRRPVNEREFTWCLHPHRPDCVQIEVLKDVHTMFALELRRGQEVRTFLVRNAGLSGWELSEEANRRRVRTVRYRDWHRVERAIALIRFEAASLAREGWEAHSQG